MFEELEYAVKCGDSTIQIEVNDYEEELLMNSQLDYEYADGYFFIENNEKLKEFINGFKINR